MIEEVLSALTEDIDDGAFAALFSNATDRAPIGLYIVLAARAIELGRIDLVRRIVAAPTTDALLRVAAAVALPPEDESAAAVVRRALDSHDVRARLLALERLSKVPDERATERLVALLDDEATIFDLWKAERVAHSAARALFAAGHADRVDGYLARQRRALDGSDLDRHFAVLLLAGLGDRKAVDALETLARADDPFGEYAEALDALK